MPYDPEPRSAEPAALVFLFDVDNTLLDNDSVTRDLRAYLTKAFGAARQERYWAIFEELRSQLGYADYLGALQRYRAENLRDPHLLATSNYLLSYPFEERLFPGALALLERLRPYGRAVILSDGDVVFQPRKIARAGLWDAFEGNVLIYIHKEQMLDDVAARYPARHYVMIDDKLHILGQMKAIWGDRVTTVFVRQGHYAFDKRILGTAPPADLTIDAIGDLDPASLLAGRDPKVG
jgi:FMN phosphatase YigB (HAD superfamily)